jgi:hypothetical protein
MTIYKLIHGSPCILKDGMTCIPPDPLNAEYAEYLRWMGEGNAPEPADMPSLEQVTANLLTASTRTVEAWLDAVAHERDYSRLSIGGYMTSPNPKWRAEAQAFIDWRDLQIWPTCYEIMSACLDGTRTVPTGDELIAELPKLEWPE